MRAVVLAAVGILGPAAVRAQIPPPTLATARGFHYAGAPGPNLGQVTAGTYGFSLQATGTGFAAVGAAPGAAVIWIPGGGAPCPGQSCVITATVASSTQLEASIPPDLLTAADPNARVAVANFPYTTLSNSLAFPVVAPLTAAATLPNATVGVSYSATVVTGGIPPYTFFYETGPFPAGLTDTPAGLLTGTPTVAGTFTVYPSINDVWFTYVSPVYTFIVNSPALTFIPSTLPGAVSGQAYSQLLTGAGGVAPYTFSVLTGNLPGGVTLASNGSLSGTPALAGSYTFQVRVADASNNTGTAPLTLVVAPTFTPANLPNGQTGVAYSLPLAGAGGTAPYVFNLLSGSLPTGLTLASSGLISGTPSAAGTFTFQVQVADASQTVGSGTRSITIGSIPTFTPTTLPGGQVTVAYSQTLSGANGTAPYTFTPGGSLPPGLTLGSGGTISGTPTAAGNYSFQVQVTDANSATGSATVSLAIGAAPSFTPATLPSGTVGAAYSQTLTPSGGTAPYTFTLTSGPLPPGLTLSASGLISGSPTTAGSYPIQIRVADANGAFSINPYDIVVNSAASISFTPLTLPAGRPGTAYSQALTGSGGTAPYTFSVVSGSLPPGISLSAAGLLSGTPTAAGASTFTVQVRDAQALTGSASLTLTVAVVTAVGVAPLSLPAAQMGSVYTAALSGTGGTAPYTFTLVYGLLPAGLTLSSSGAIAGTPLQSGTFNFHIQATDAAGASGSATVTLAVRAALQIVTLSLPQAVLQQPYSAQLQASGGQPPYVWSLTGGSLPFGLTLSAAGIISGTPNGQGPAGLVFVLVRDAAGQVASRAFDLSPLVPPPVVSPLSLPGGTVGTAYSYIFTATGGSGGLTWSVVAGALPPGLSLSPGGVVSGSPTTAGDYSFDVRAVDSGGRAGTATARLRIDPPPVSITTGPLGSAAGGPLSFQFAATGGIPPYTWSLSGGALPAGLSLSPGGLLAGQTQAIGAFDFRITATDSRGTSSSRNYSLQLSGLPLRILTVSLPVGAINTPYAAAFAGEGGRPPYQWTVSGLPQGLAAAGGAISGVPGEDGTFRIQVELADSAGARAQASFDLTVDPPPLSIAVASLAPATAGANYSASFGAAGGRPPYNWLIASGLVPGLTLTGAGVLSGVPSAAGDYPLVVLVSDARGVSVRVETSFTVRAAPLAIVTRSLAAGTAGQPYSQTLQAAGGAPPYTWSAILPPGLAIDRASGTISGTPTVAGPVSCQATVSDSAGVSVSATLAGTFGLPPAPSIGVAGLPDTMEPMRQAPLQLTVGATFPVPIAGTATLTFRGDAGVDDPTIQFSSGGRSVAFTIAAGSTEAVFASGVALQNGTLAGVVTVTLRLQAAGTDITPDPTPTRQIRINPGPPAITSVRATRTAGGIEVQLSGYSNTREATQAVFRFTPAAGGTLQTGELTVAVESIFAAWYNSAASLAFGGQFQFTQTFTLQGSTAVASVTATLANRQGVSNSATANLQ